MTRDYGRMLTDGYEAMKGQPPRNRLQFLGQFIFQFETDDPAMTELFARKALGVCGAISDRKTFEYIENEEDYTWFLLMANFSFFRERIEWGVSIRGAGWSSEIPCRIDLDTCGLWEGGRQVPYLAFEDRDDWGRFIAALRHFAVAHYTRLLIDAGDMP